MDARAWRCGCSTATAQPIVDWLKTKFAKKPELAEANIAALNAGHAYGETVEIGGQVHQHHIAAAPAEPGLYRTVTGAESLSLGLVAGAQLAGLPMFFGSYPITPASPILHHLSRLKEYGITTFQAEDEIAAICAAMGASYAGQLGRHLLVRARASRSRARRSALR